MDPALIRQYRCVTCSFTSNVFPEIIDHNIINHPESELKIKVYLSDKKTLHTKNFGIVPGKLLNNGYYIHSNKGKDIIFQWNALSDLFFFWQDLVLILFQKLSIIFLPAKGRNLTTRFTIKDE
jgi:hypothetical protein